MSNKSRRKIILINRKFQYKLIAKFLLVNLFILVLFGGILYLFLNSEVEANLHSAHVTYKNMQSMLLPIVITLTVLNVLVSSIIIWIFVLFASHRIAGPMFRFNAAIEEMIDGNLLAHTTLREGDQFYDCSVTLTELRDHFATEVKTVNELLKTVEKKSEATEEINQIKEILQHYKV